MQNYEVIFYDLEDGTEPAKEFLLSLDVKMRAKMLRTIDLLAVNGVELREPHSKPLDDGIFELRAKVGSDITRVLYFFMVGKRVILTSGFAKKQQRRRPRRLSGRSAIEPSTSAERTGSMSKYSDFLAEQLKSPALKAEYDALEPEFSLIQTMIDARKAAGLTQKQLADKTGIAQSDISKLETGSANPSLRTLQRLAQGMGMKMKIEFIPFAG